MKKTQLSVIFPIYNEESVLPHLYERALSVLVKLGLDYEIIFVNDSSSDRSLEILQGFNQINPKVKILSFSRNFGHQMAITAGLHFSRGDAVIILDGDLQDPPEIIPQFLEKWREGYQVVYAVRATRKDPLPMRILYKMYYRLLKAISKTEIPLDSGDCCLIDHKVVNLINSIPERNRFVRGLRSWVGFRQAGIRYDRDKRFAGKPKYTFFKLLHLAMDGIISFSEIPLKISILIGFFVSISSLLYSVYLIANTIFNFQHRIPGWASIVVGITLLGGVQLTVMGFLGEYIIRIFDEVKGRPPYILNGCIGFDDNYAENIRRYSGL